MVLQENLAGDAVPFGIARGFGNLSSTVRPVQKGSVLPFGFILSSVVRAVFTRTGSVFGGGGGFRGVSAPACARIRRSVLWDSIGEFTGNTRGYLALTKAVAEKMRQLQESGCNSCGDGVNGSIREFNHSRRSCRC